MAPKKGKHRDSKLVITSFHEAGHAVAARICGFPLEHIEICVRSGKGREGETRAMFGETHHLHYHKIFYLLAGPLAERFADYGARYDGSIGALKDVAEATILIMRLMKPDDSTPAKKAQSNSTFKDSFIHEDEINFVSHHLNAISREANVVLDSSAVKHAIDKLGNRLIELGNGVLPGTEATHYIDSMLGHLVGSLAPPNWYVNICRNSIGWDQGVYDEEWRQIKEGLTIYTCKS